MKLLVVLLMISFVLGSEMLNALQESELLSSSSGLPNCTSLPDTEVSCIYDCGCKLGFPTNVTCKAAVPCSGSPVFVRLFTCQFCFQTHESLHICSSNKTCMAGSKKYFISNCTVPPSVLCLGNRVFQKLVNCSVISNKSWKVAMFLSVFLGGFAADRFYLGYIGWGMFKLLSFGGLGVWAIVDVLLLATGFLGPYDGSSFASSNETIIKFN